MEQHKSPNFDTKQRNSQIPRLGWSQYFYLVGMIQLLLVMFLLPGYSFAGYSILANSLSELGAQFSPNGWIMNCVFMQLGWAVLWLFWKIEIPWLHRVLIFFFGMSFILVGVFQLEPRVPDVPVNELEARLHSLFATLMGVSISLFAFLTAACFAFKRDIFVAVGVGTASTGLSAIIFAVPEYSGLSQRVMFLLVLGWLLSASLALSQSNRNRLIVRKD